MRLTHNQSAVNGIRVNFFYQDGIACNVYESGNIHYSQMINGIERVSVCSVKDTPKNEFEETLIENVKVDRILRSLNGKYVEIKIGFRETKELYILQPKIEGFIGNLIKINDYDPNEHINALFNNRDKLTALVGDALHVGATQILPSSVLEITLCDENGLPVESVYKYN